MDKFAKLVADIGKLWEHYAPSYFTGMQNTLILAVVATLAGCIIGLLCGILNTIPYTQSDPPLKRFFLKLLRVLIRIYVKYSAVPPWCCRLCSFSMACLTLPTVLLPSRA